MNVVIKSVFFQFFFSDPNGKEHSFSDTILRPGFLLELENGTVHPVTGFTKNLMLTQKIGSDLFSEASKIFR
jgi:hypothetical protein